MAKSVVQQIAEEKQGTRRLNLKLEGELHRKYHAVAVEEGETLQSLTTKLIKSYVKQKKQK